MTKQIEFYGVDFLVEYEEIAPDPMVGYPGEIEITGIAAMGDSDYIDMFGFFHDANLIGKLTEKLNIG